MRKSRGEYQKGKSSSLRGAAENWAKINDFHAKSQVTQTHYLCHVRVSYNMSKYIRQMGRSLGLEIC